MPLGIRPDRPGSALDFSCGATELVSGRKSPRTNIFRCRFVLQPRHDVYPTNTASNRWQTDPTDPQRKKYLYFHRIHNIRKPDFKSAEIKRDFDTRLGWNVSECLNGFPTVWRLCNQALSKLISYSVATPYERGWLC